jgi:UPF0755 protein
MKKLVGILILAFFCFTLGFAMYIWDHFANERNSTDATEVVFEVKPGMSFPLVVKTLESEGLIKNTSLFSLFAKVKGEAGKMKVGEYAIKKNLYPGEVLSIINSGKSIGRLFTVPEGTNIFEISEMYEEEGFGKKEDFFRLVRDKEFIKSLTGKDLESLEGYLFPETYSVTKFTEPKVLVTMMYQKFLKTWADLEPMTASIGMNQHQIVTLASIIEKETGAPVERPLISSVFHNRMRIGMKLQTDPTVLYGKADLLGGMVMNITRADLTTPTRYNTYTIPALPPGPIANPSKEALLAVIQPATSEYLYFVSKNDGTHTFSKDYGGHLKAVKAFQMDPKAREGKSWRDLKKKRVDQTAEK